jgi:hypothetical protein
MEEAECGGEAGGSGEWGSAAGMTKEGGRRWLGIRKWKAKAKGAAGSGDGGSCGRQWGGGERRRQERQAARG